MPRYFFVLHTPHRRHDDPHGTQSLNPEAAQAHAQRIVRELRESGGHAIDGTMVVYDETGT